MHSIQTILNDARLIEEASEDADVRSLASLVQHLALRLQDAEALAATNELKLKSAVNEGRPSSVACV